MNENPPSQPPAFKDRKTGLKVFGVLTTCLGGLSALMVLFLAVALSIQKPATVPQPDQRGLAMAMGEYGGIAIVLVTLGIGSILARRWARALMLIFSWFWLFMGVCGIVGVYLVMTSPEFMESLRSARPAGQPPMPSAVGSIMLMVTIGIEGFFLVLLPAVWIFFYGSKHVKVTCEAYNPKTSWADRCPLPVLALCLVNLFGGLMMLVFPFFYSGVLPFFGRFVSGVNGSIACVCLAALFLYSAQAMYRLRVHGWWIVFATVCLFAVSGVITYSRHDITELYQAMGFPKEQIAQLQKFNFFKGDRMMWLTIISVVPWLGYCLWVRKYFDKSDRVSLGE